MAKIIVPTTKLKDIGELDNTIRLPTASRIKLGMKTICDRCGKPIIDEFFIGGFKKGYPNMKFHENCVDKP
jgi:hypothetical protein